MGVCSSSRSDVVSGTANRISVTTGNTPVVDAITSAVTSISTNLATGAQIQTAINTAVANVGAFQGAYDAATNTPDLDTAPSAAIQNGWFWAVTVAGTFFTENVQIGDFIFANQDNPGATFANWTVIQSGQDIAGSGTTDGATVKGVAGFNSNDFDVSVNGWVEAKDFSGSTPGYVPDTTGAVAGTFLSKTGSWVIPPNTGGTVTGTGAATQVTFWDGTSNVNGDTAFNWDNTNKRLGIGTNTPDKNLHVEGTSAGVKIESTSSNSSSQLDLKSTTTTWSIGQNIFAVNTGVLEFYNGTTAKLVVDTSGKVGIGATTPDTLLHIMGASSGAYIASTINNTNVNGFVKQDFKIGTSHASISYEKGVFFAIGPDINDTTTPIVFRNNNAAERMRISSSGAIKFNAYGSGTNTGTAAYSLAVDSSGNIIEEAAGGDISGSGNGSSVTYFTGVVGDTGVKEITSNPNIVIDSNGYLGLGTSNPLYSLDIDSIYATPTIQVQDSQQGNFLRLSSDGGSFSSKIESSNDIQFIDGNGNMLMNMTTMAGYVGIGTTAVQFPNSKLHINDQYATSLLTLESDSETQRTDYRYTSGGINPYASFGTDMGDFTMDLLYQGNQTRLFNFNKDGRLGIGPYVVPNYALDVQEGSMTGNDTVINVQSQMSYNQLQIGAGVNFGSTNYIDSNVAFQIKRSSTDVMHIDFDTMYYAPRVGINTTQPVVSFEIATQDAIKIPVGSNSDRSGIMASDGMLRYNTDALEFEGYSNNAWGAIGGGGAPVIIKESFSPFVGQTNYDLNPLGQNNPQDENYVNVYIDGVYQNLNTIAGVNTTGSGASAMTTVTMVSGAPAGVTVEIVSTI